MRKFSVILALFLILSLVPLTASADEKDASLSVSSRTTESGNIFIFASINDIKSSGGISYLDYIIEYDPSVLELKNALVNMPDTWGSNAEDWSGSIAAGEYSWSVFNIDVGYPVKEDNQLFIELEFIPLLDNAVSSIKFECIDIYGDDLTTPLSGKSVEIEITVAKDEDDNIIVSDSTVVENDNSDEGSDNNSNNGNAGGQSSSGTNGTVDNGGSETENQASSDDSVHVGVELNGEDNGDNGINSTAIIIIAVVLALTGGAVAVLFFIRSKKGDK